MELSDAGFVPREIARHLGISNKYATDTVSRFTVNTYREAREADALRAQTRKLGKIVVAAGGHR